jgi:hypothetical protein
VLPVVQPPVGRSGPPRRTATAHPTRSPRSGPTPRPDSRSDAPVTDGRPAACTPRSPMRPSAHSMHRPEPPRPAGLWPRLPARPSPRPTPADDGRTDPRSSQAPRHAARPAPRRRDPFGGMPLCSSAGWPPGPPDRRRDVPKVSASRHSPPVLRLKTCDQQARACPTDHGTGSRSQILIEATSTVPRNM